MIVRKKPQWVIFFLHLCVIQSYGERWSRQTSNSEWIPLANPRNNEKNEGHVPIAPVTLADSIAQPVGQASVLSLPPTLQQQYQEQLLQLQKTQESIQRLLLLQEQLKAQQQLLQSQAYQTNGFMNTDDEKQALHQSTIINLQTLPILAPEVLVPPVLTSKALPPVFESQDFHTSNANTKFEETRPNKHVIFNSPIPFEENYHKKQEEFINQNRYNNSEQDYHVRPKIRYDGMQKNREQAPQGNFMTPKANSEKDSSDKQQEIQLVYVPAETLAQRGQVKLHKPQSRKHHTSRHNQNNNIDITSTSLPVHDAYAREILHQLQRQHEEKSRFFNEERQKEIARLHAEQKELEKQARLHQEVVRKEQELMRKREDEKKRKELSKIEEASRQQELYRIQELREKERQAELKLAEYKANEDRKKQAEFERLSNFEKKKEIPQKKEYAQNNEQKSKIITEAQDSQRLANVPAQSYESEIPEAQSLVRGPQFHQHLTEVTDINTKRLRHKQRNKLNNYYTPEVAESQPTTPSPNQPPLSIYLNTNAPNHHRSQLIEALKQLRNTRTIAVLDSFGSHVPNLFVGPKYLDPPAGFVKFDLPYLSSFESNNVERKINKLPFFVAPLSFDPPHGHSKIPFPAPHIGSIVINSLENIEKMFSANENLNLTPLIEPNSHISSNQPLFTYDTNTPASYFKKSSTLKYDVSSLPPSQSSTKLKLSGFYDGKPVAEIPLSSTEIFYNNEQTSSNKFEHFSTDKNYNNLNELSTTPGYSDSKTITRYSFEQTIPQSTPLYQEETTNNRNVVPQFPNSNIAQQGADDYLTSEQYQQKNERYVVDPTGHTVTNKYVLNLTPNYDEDTQYNLPAELPAISPQLPGLVNALVEKNEAASTFHPLTTTTPSTTTATVTDLPTTYRSRKRQRGRSTTVRAATTSAAPKGNSDRGRKPITRSRSKHTTTTEQYSDSFDDSARRNINNTSRYNEKDINLNKNKYENQKYKTEDDDAAQITHSSDNNEQVYSSNDYKKINSPSFESRDTSFNSDENVQGSLNNSAYNSVVYSTSIPSSIDNISQNNFGISGSTKSVHYYDQNRKYTQTPNSPSSVKQTDVNQQPLNEYSYRSYEGTFNSPNNQNFPYYKPERTESNYYETIITTESPNVQKSQLQDFSPVYHAVSVNDQYVDNENPTPSYIKQSISNDKESPIFLPISETKQDNLSYPAEIDDSSYETTSPATTTTTTMTTTTTTTTTTEAPVLIRQRGRNRSNTRNNQRIDSVIQTQSNGPQNEYVRFSAVHQDAKKSNSRHRATPRSRASQAPQVHSQIQTNGQEYVRIQSGSVQQRRPTSSSIATQSSNLKKEQANEDDYGFIRSPNYNLSQQSSPETTEARNSDASNGTDTDESILSRAQILKNRQKSHAATRRPVSNRITTTPSSEDVNYPIRSRVRGDQAADAKSTKSRSRSRRPGARKRTTTTTASTLDTHNDFPADDNDSRADLQKSDDEVTNARSDSLKENNSPFYNRGQPSGKHASKYDEDLTDENYPQEFLLNYGTSQNIHRADYDQAQLTTDLSRRHYSREGSTTVRSVPDIYGAESQWSTKLTDNSFQPSSYSLAQVENKSKKSLDAVGNAKAGDLPEIITISPNQPSITVFVTSNDGEVGKSKLVQFEESIADATSNTMNNFGEKMNAGEQNNNVYNAQTAYSSENVLGSEGIKNNNATMKKAGLRRRRVRVRVRPAGSTSEDFVTSESQVYDSKRNHLSGKPSKLRNFHIITTSAPVIQESFTTATAPEYSETENSLIETSLDKLAEKKENDTTTIVTNDITTTQMISSDESWSSVTTIIPDILIDDEEVTTLQDKSTSFTNPPQTISYSTNSNNKEQGTDNKQFPSTTPSMLDNKSTASSLNMNEMALASIIKKSEEKKNNIGESIVQLLNSENTLKYLVTKSPAFNEYLRSQEKTRNAEVSNGNLDYPKNHRSKWSEVRYPFDKSFDFAKWNDKNPNQSKEVKNKDGNGEGNHSSNSSATDYVSAIFESIKSADEINHLSTNQNNEATLNLNKNKVIFRTESSSVLPKEIKTSVTSSSTVISQPEVNSIMKQDNVPTKASTESTTLSPFVPSMVSDKTIGPVMKIPLETNLGKILKTTTTTKVSHMTEICYRGRCVMSKPKKEGLSR